MYRQIRWPLAYARIGLLYDYDYTHLHVYANVLDLLREVKNIVRQLSRVIPGRHSQKQLLLVSAGSMAHGMHTYTGS